jgi:DNA-binding CsgD family transcriptional regulator
LWTISSGVEGGMLRGRERECRLLDDMVKTIRSGGSCSLLLRGEPGIGKTALLDYLCESADGCRVLRMAGFESETELVFAALHRLCWPVLDEVDRLPAPQQTAVQGAFGNVPGGHPDPFFIGLGILSLLSEVAADKPLLCVIDDAQWLDKASAQALGFAARRLEAESVALVFAEREPVSQVALTGLPDLPVLGLPHAEARQLLDSALHVPLDESIREQIITDTGGNPLAILELPRNLTIQALAGGFGLPATQPMSGRIEESFRSRLDLLAADTRLLVLLAAAEPTGEPSLLWRAAELLAIPPEAADQAEAADLVQFDSGVTFRHPLVRSAIYGSASAKSRRNVHSALAAATDRQRDPDRRAWHRAKATITPDEEVASELEDSAGRAESRGGLAAAAAFFQRAAALTPAPDQRARRTLAAARVSLDSGAPDLARRLLNAAERGPLDPLQEATLARLQGQLAFHLRRGGDASPLLLAAALKLQPLNVDLARETLLDALWAAYFAGRLGGRDDVRRVCDAALTAAFAPREDRTIDILLSGIATHFNQGYETAVPALRRAVDDFLTGNVPTPDEVRWSMLATCAATDLWADDAWYALAIRHVKVCREIGALTVLPFALDYLALAEIHGGDLQAAATLIDEIDTICAVTGTASLAYASLTLAALREPQDHATSLIEAAVRDATARNEGFEITSTEYASAILHNGAGRYNLAFPAAHRAYGYDDAGFFPFVTPELIEAAARSGRPDVAAEALRPLSEHAQAVGTSWALGVEARCRALLTPGPAAEAVYRAALQHLQRCRGVLDLARARLLYGEWLRRERRRAEAREQLRSAHEAFLAMGAFGFAERTARELLATGEHARKRTVQTESHLTAQENQIATLARAGLSNAEIGTRLFISPRTVEYHLRKIYTKLSIGSRADLPTVWPKSATTGN